MNTTIDRTQRAKVLPTQINGKTIKALFKKYEKIGFLYPEKKALLMPHYPQINANWDSLLKSKERLLWMVTTKNQILEEDFASITAWKQGNYGLFAQHLVSTGNPLLSLKVMMAAQNHAEFQFSEEEVKSCQNWFRPTNRYAYRVFASMYDRLGKEKASLILFQYLHMPLSKIGKTNNHGFEVEEVTGVDDELIEFVKNQYGKVFMQAEELDRMDIQLTKLNAVFQQYGMIRCRKILKIRDVETQQIIACVVANRAPLGLNFSFLENRAYYIFAEDLDNEKRSAAVATLNAAICSFYQNFKLQAIPIVTDEITAKTLLAQQAVFQRKYMQSIWLREGFSEWYNHIYSFLERIEGRMKKRQVEV